MTVGTIVLGDLNLDWSKHFDNNYNLKNYFMDMDEKLENHNLMQIIELPTWSRTINVVLRESILDHVYLENPHIISEVTHSWPIFTDHFLISIYTNHNKADAKQVWRRYWRIYSKEEICSKLARLD